MAKYEIKMTVDAAQAIEPAEKTAKAFTKVSTSLKSAGDELKKVDTGFKASAESAKKLGKDIEGTGTATEKLTSRKRGLADGLKKLGQEIPIVGAALNFLKNPFTLLGGAAVAAASSVRAVVDEVNNLSAAEAALNSFNSVAVTTLELQAKLKSEAIAYREELANIGTNLKTGAEHLKELNDQLERQFAIEEKLRPDDPTRERRKGIGAATALFNAGTRGRDIADAAAAQLPAAEAELLASNAALLEEQKRQAPAASLDAAKRARAEAKITSANKKLLGLDESGVSGEEKRNLQARYEAERQSGLDELAAANLADDSRKAVLEQLNRPVSAARKRVTQLRDTELRGRQEFEQFRGQAAGQFQQLNQNLLAQDPGQPARLAEQQMVQRRADKLIELLGEIAANTAGAKQARSDAHGKMRSQQDR